MRICTRQLQIALLNTTPQKIAQSLPQSFDFFIDTLLKLLDTSEPGTRQIAAVSLAKVTQLLPDLFKEEVVDELLSYLSPEQSAETFSGTLVTLGELSRLGGIKEQKINQLLSQLLKVQNMYFANKQAMVLDSIAFCLWCISKSNISKEFYNKDLIQKLAANLSVQSLLSFNLTTRRTSAAAFQQMCGSLGQDLIQNAILAASIPDFCQISDVQYCYLNLAIKLSKLDFIYCNAQIQYILDNIIYNESDKQMLMGKLLGLLIKQQDYQQLNNQIIQLLQQKDDYICWDAAASILNGCQNSQLNYEQIKSIVIQQLEYINTQSEQIQFQTLQSFSIILLVLMNNNIQFLQSDQKIILQFINQYFKQTLTNNLNLVSLTTYDILFKNTFLAFMNKFNQLYNVQYDTWREISIRSALTCCQLTNVQDYMYLYSKSKEPITNNNRLYILHSIQLYKQIMFQNNDYIQFILDFLQFCVNDFSVDKRGEIGQQVRHKTLIVLNDIIQFIQDQENDFKEQLYQIYINCILIACSNRSDYLKLDGLLSLKYLLSIKKDIIPENYKIQLNFYLQKPIKNQKQNTKQEFDINDLTNEDIKKQMDEQNNTYIKSSYNILDILAKVNSQWAYIIYKQLVYDITFCSENELNKTIKLIKLQKQQDFYQFLIKLFNNEIQTTYQLGMNYSIIVTVQFLLYHEYVPQLSQLEQILKLIEKYLSFTQINFYSFQSSFNIYSYIINYLNGNNIKNYAKKQLISYINNQTLKLRQQASESIIECCILSKEEQIIQLILKQDVMNLKLIQCQSLMNEVEKLWIKQ